MPQTPFTKGKLIPLRHFSLDGLYSTAYLSQLVQRGKLKAERVGRNYFTKPEWFAEYLELHARDEIRLAYIEYFAEIEKEENTDLNTDFEESASESGNRLFNFIKLKYTAIMMAVFVLLFSLAMIVLMQFNDNGQIAGEEENATSSVSSIVY